jgi:lysozyme
MSARDVIRQHKGKLTGAAAAIALTSALIVHWEGEKLVASHNSFDPPGVVDVCNGVTNYDLPWLKAGMVFTHEDCEALRQRLIPKYRDPLKVCIKGFEVMPVARQAALGSAAYNLGSGTVCKSTAVRLLNDGDTEGGCRALGNFIKANGVVLKGLVNRRQDSTWGEIAWCMEND